MPAHLRLLLLAFLRKNRMTKPTQQGELHDGKIALVERERARYSLLLYIELSNSSDWPKAYSEFSKSALVTS